MCSAVYLDGMRNNTAREKLARAWARRAHTKLFQHHWGVTAAGITVVWYTNGHADHVDDVVKALEALGLSVTGRAEYPKSGHDRGYTVALVVEGTMPVDPGRVAAVWRRVFLDRHPEAESYFAIQSALAGLPSTTRYDNILLGEVGDESADE